MGLRYSDGYPFLLLLVRVLYLGANNPGTFSLADLVTVSAVGIAAALAFYLLVALAIGRVGDGRVPALVTFAAVAVVIGAPALGPNPWQPPPVWACAIGVAAITALVLTLVHRPSALRLGSLYLSNMYLILAAWLAGDIAYDRLRAHARLARSSLVTELERPIAAPARQLAGPHRSIYLLILDEYANAATLREFAGFDNRVFEDSLHRLGFRVPSAMHSNYAHTNLSLASLLNAAQIDRITSELPPGDRDPTLVNYLASHSRVARFLQARGYRFVFYPSAWWLATQTSPLADSVVAVGRGLGIARSLSRTEFRRVLWQNSVLAWFYREAGGDAVITREVITGIGQLPGAQRPVFAVAHVLSPHLPYVLAADCRSRPAVWVRDRAAYLAQLQCVNRLVLATVGRLLSESPVQPIIILLGDHGTAFLDFSSAPTLAQVPASAARERFGAFGAYYLPDGSDMGDTTGLADVLGHVLREYFGARVDPTPDQQYLSLERAPFDLRRVDPAWLSSADAAGSPR